MKKPNVPCIRIEDVPLKTLFGSVYVVELDGVKRSESQSELGLDVNYYQFTTEDIGKYNSNNGVVCFIGEDSVYITPFDRETVKELENQGFKRNFCLYVPFSNSEEILDAGLEYDFKKIKENLKKY